MLEIKGYIAGPDARWSFFQAPLVVEDALGYKFPVPSEYDFDLLDAVIRQKFNTGPGSLDVRAGNYEYFKTRNSKNVLSKSSRLLPGTAITMAIIVVHPTLTDQTCPMPGCGSIRTIESIGGGRTWYVISMLSMDQGLPRQAVYAMYGFRRLKRDEDHSMISSPQSPRHQTPCRMKANLPTLGEPMKARNLHPLKKMQPCSRM